MFFCGCEKIPLNRGNSSQKSIGRFFFGGDLFVVVLDEKIGNFPLE